MSAPGYTVRRQHGRAYLALCIKVHRSPSAEDCASVAEELAVKADERAPTGPRSSIAPTLAWGPGWIEALCNADPQVYAELEGFARESAFEQAEEDARELLGQGVKLWSDGRSGGWLILEGVGPDEVTEAVALLKTPAPDETDEDGTAARDDAAGFLRNLERFREYVSAAVADFPRAVAWQVCANAFQPALEAERARTARRDAEERVERAAQGLERAAQFAVERTSDSARESALGTVGLALDQLNEARDALAALPEGAV